MKAQHKQDIAALNKEWNGKLADVVAKVRVEEQDKAAKTAERVQNDFNRKENELVN